MICQVLLEATTGGGHRVYRLEAIAPPETRRGCLLSPRLSVHIFFHAADLWRFRRGNPVVTGPVAKPGRDEKKQSFLRQTEPRPKELLKKDSFHTLPHRAPLHDALSEEATPAMSGH